MEKINQRTFQWINMENKTFLESILKNLLEEENIELLEEYGKEIYNKKISFSELAIFLDSFSYTLENSKRSIYKQNINILAKGYVFKRFTKEIVSIKLGIHNNPNFISSTDIAIIDELLEWMESLVESFQKDTALPAITNRYEEFQQFVIQRDGLFFENKTVKEDFLTTASQLYGCANDAVAFFQRQEYFYFTLVYIELVALFLKLVTLLSGMFLEEELLSVYIDPVTMLPNRFQLLKDITSFQNCYIMIINIKSFAKLNVTYGYDTGDGILKKIATFLQRSNGLKSYRIYADEFAILVRSPQEAQELFDELNRSINIYTDGNRYDIFFYGAYDKFEDKALEACEFAIAKSDKKSLVNSQMIASLKEGYKQELTMLQKLKQVMIYDSIIPYFQPIYSEKPDKKVIKYEVLMRVEYDGEIFSPYAFLDVLKEAPFYVEFTKTILLKSFQTFQDKSCTFSVNFTVADIKDKSLRTFLDTLIAKYPQTAQRLTIEITEAEALKDFDELNNFIDKYRAKGVSFSLDDFGSGYANFAQFAKLHIDFVKIDGTIIEHIIEDQRMQSILDSILRFTESMDLKVIAEYVWNKEVFEYLRNKVDMLQGYYIGEPKPHLLIKA